VIVPRWPISEAMLPFPFLVRNFRRGHPPVSERILSFPATIHDVRVFLPSLRLSKDKNCAQRLPYILFFHLRDIRLSPIRIHRQRFQKSSFPRSSPFPVYVFAALCGPRLSRALKPVSCRYGALPHDLFTPCVWPAGRCLWTPFLSL